MMARPQSRIAGLIFCALGSVCAGPALGQTQGASGNEEEEVIELFNDEGDANAAQQKVEVGSFGQIDLQVKDLDVTDVLRLLSMQSKKNIIASRNVSGKVSANLFGVDFHQALKAILEPNGFGYREDGDFIYVYTKQELEEIEASNRTRVTEVVHLNYLNAADAQTIVTPLMSDEGELAISSEASQGFQPSLSDAGADSYAGTPALVITDYEENVEEMISLLDKLDVRPKQVLIEATVLEARLTEDNAFGVDFSIFADVDFADFVNPLNAVNDLVDGDAGQDSGSVVQSQVGSNAVPEGSGLKLGFLGSNFSVFVQALDSVTDTTVLSVPKILTLNRQKADLLVGRRLGYVNTTTTDTSQTTNVEFIEDGTQLTVRPFVSEDGFVRLELRPSVSTAEVVEVADNAVPNETTSELTTNIIVRSGQTLVLGGLFTEQTSIGRNQVPGLGNIPVAGIPFRGQNDSISRSEIIFLIKPTVLKDESLLASGDEIESEISDLRAGMRQGLLPWSRTKLTQSYMKRALSLVEEGEQDRALWNINLALAISPTATDALELRSRLTGEKVFLRDTEIWGRAVSDTIDDSMNELAPDSMMEEPIGDASDSDQADDAETASQAGAEPETGDEATEADAVESDGAADRTDREADTRSTRAVREPDPAIGDPFGLMAEEDEPAVEPVASDAAFDDESEMGVEITEKDIVEFTQETTTHEVKETSGQAATDADADSAEAEVIELFLEEEADTEGGVTSADPEPMFQIPDEVQESASPEASTTSAEPMDEATAMKIVEEIEKAADTMVEQAQTATPVADEATAEADVEAELDLFDIFDVLSPAAQQGEALTEVPTE